MALVPSTSQAPARPPGYAVFLEQFAARIRRAQLRAVSAVNAETILLYYESGRAIRAEQAAKGWGARVIQQLSVDLKRQFPDARGYSPRHLRYMRDFADAWPNESIVREVLTQLSTWFTEFAATLIQQADAGDGTP